MRIDEYRTTARGTEFMLAFLIAKVISLHRVFAFEEYEFFPSWIDIQVPIASADAAIAANDLTIVK